MITETVGRPQSRAPFDSVYRPVFEDGEVVGSIWTLGNTKAMECKYWLTFKGVTFKFPTLSRAKRKAFRLAGKSRRQ